MDKVKIASELVRLAKELSSAGTVRKTYYGPSSNVIWVSVSIQVERFFAKAIPSIGKKVEGLLEDVVDDISHMNVAKLSMISDATVGISPIDRLPVIISTVGVKGERENLERFEESLKLDGFKKMGPH